MAGTPEEMERLHQASDRKRVWIVVAVIAVVAILIAVAALAGWFSPAAQHTTLLGAGATFPYPLISKWSSVYVNLTGVQVNYQAIGSGGGISQITAKTVDFAGSDAPLKPSERATAPGLLHIPETIGAVAAAYNVGSLSTGLNLRARARGDLPRERDDLERSKHRRTESGSDLAEYDAHGRAPVRQQRDDVRLDELSPPHEPGLELVARRQVDQLAKLRRLNGSAG